jgi:hypothetical protein
MSYKAGSVSGDYHGQINGEILKWGNPSMMLGFLLKPLSKTKELQIYSTIKCIQDHMVHQVWQHVKISQPIMALKG